MMHAQKNIKNQHNQHSIMSGRLGSVCECIGFESIQVHFLVCPRTTIVCCKPACVQVRYFVNFILIPSVLSSYDVQKP
jgi:hypothetical protein